MGSGMAFNLLKAGYELTVWNRSAKKCEPFDRKGARVADTPADAVSDVGLVIYMLSNDQAVEEVVFGGRHEMLHEINRRDVITNLLVWISGVVNEVDG